VIDEVVPPARKLRWPILVVLDQMGEEHWTGSTPG
jgi:hypothetical protein